MLSTPLLYIYIKVTVTKQFLLWDHLQVTVTKQPVIKFKGNLNSWFVLLWEPTNDAKLVCFLCLIDFLRVNLCNGFCRISIDCVTCIPTDCLSCLGLPCHVFHILLLFLLIEICSKAALFYLLIMLWMWTCSNKG